MNFIGAITESVLLDVELARTIAELKLKLLNGKIKERITNEINKNWIEKNTLESETLKYFMQKIVSSNYDLTVKIDNTLDYYGEFDPDDRTIVINLKETAKEMGLFKIMKIKNRIVFIDDFILDIINTLSHELTHYAQFKTRQFKVLNMIKNKMEYSDDKEEMMSFAIGIAQTIKGSNFTKDEALDIISLKDDDFYQKDLKDFVRMKSHLKNWKTFLRYLYDYIQNHWEEL